MVYKSSSVAGGSIASGGAIVSINADTTPAQVIAAGSGINVSTAGGTTTITNTSAGSAGVSSVFGRNGVVTAQWNDYQFNLIGGVASVSQGGTGVQTLSPHGVLLGEGTANVSAATTGVAGRLLLDQGNADPSFQILTGDSTLASNGVMVNLAVHGVSYPASPSTNTVPVVTSSNIVTYETVPNAALTNSAITIGAQTGLAGGGTVALGSAITLSMGTNAANTLAGYNNSGVFSDVAIGSSLGLVGGVLSNTSSASVISVFGRIGAVVAQAGDYGFSLISGTAQVSQGGTGQTTLSAHGVLLGEGTSGVSAATTGTSGRLLIDQGSGNDPAFEIVSGDAVIAATGAITLATVNSNIGTFNYSTINAKGLTTAISQGSAYRFCRVAAPALTATYNNGASGIGATLTNSGAQSALVIGSTTPITMNINDRVLAPSQASQFQCGIYTVTNTGSVSTNWVLTRATDFDNSTAGNVTEGATVSISEGDFAGTIYIEKGQGPFTLGTTPIFFDLNSAGSISGILPVSQGGTGDSTLTAHAVLLGEGGVTGVGFATTGIAGRLLVDQGGVDPAFEVMSGDVSLLSTGATTVLAVHGVIYPSSPSTNTVPVVTSSNTITYEQVPNAALANSSITLNAVSGITGGGTVALGSAISVGMGTNTANTLAGYNSSGVFSDVTIGSNLTLSGGTLSATGGGGGSGNASALTDSITQISHGFSIGNVLKFTGLQYALAEADNATDAEVVGIVSSVSGANGFVLTTSGYVTGISGVSSGVVYFLSAASAGALTSIDPAVANIPGTVSKPLLIPDTSTSGYFNNWRGEVVGTNISTNQTFREVSFALDGNGSAISAISGSNTWYLATVPYAGTITSWSLVGDKVGSLDIDVWKANGAVPTISNTITASAQCSLASTQSVFNGPITGWTSAVSRGDCFAFNLISASSVTKSNLTIYITAS